MSAATLDALDLGEGQMWMAEAFAEGRRRGAVCGECSHFEGNDLGAPEIGICVDVSPVRRECGKCGKARYEFETYYEWARASDPADDCARFAADWREPA